MKKGILRRSLIVIMVAICMLGLMACDNGRVAAQKRREHQKDPEINVSDGIDKIRAHFFLINGKHKTANSFL